MKMIKLVMFVCCLLLVCSVVVAAPLVRGSGKMKVNQTVQVQTVAGGEDKQDKYVIISIFFVLLVVAVALFVLYMKVRVGSRRSA